MHNETQTLGNRGVLGAGYVKACVMLVHTRVTLLSQEPDFQLFLSVCTKRHDFCCSSLSELFKKNRPYKEIVQKRKMIDMISAPYQSSYGLEMYTYLELYFHFWETYCILSTQIPISIGVSLSTLVQCVHVLVYFWHYIVQVMCSSLLGSGTQVCAYVSGSTTYLRLPTCAYLQTFLFSMF